MKNALAFMFVALTFTSLAAKAEKMTDLPMDGGGSRTVSVENKKISTSANDGYQAVDKTEGAWIVQAIGDALSGYSKLTCVISENDTSSTTTENYELAALTGLMDKYSVVYRKLGSQPVLKISFAEGYERSVLFITTNSSGKSITQVELKTTIEQTAVTTNVGTIAEPHYINKAPAPVIQSKKCVLVK